MSAKRKNHKGRILKTGESQRKDLIYPYRYTDFRGKSRPSTQPLCRSFGKKLHPDSPLPHITPHVFRHTSCTNYANDGMDIKDLQYLMGHSDAGVTLNVYTHASYAHAAEQVAKISEFRQKGVAVG